MPYYVKVTKKVKEAIVPSYVGVTKTADDNYLLYQSALSSIEGNTLSDRAERVGGAILNIVQAKQEINGTATPATCHTPKIYGGEDETIENPSSDMPSGDAPEYTQGVEIPSVSGDNVARENKDGNDEDDASSNLEENNEDNVNSNQKEESEVNNE